MKRSLTLALLALLLSSSAFAHGQGMHCHIKDTNGVIADDMTLTSKSSCETKGGEWTHHGPHCHTKDAEGNVVDAPKAKSRYACEKEKGVWEDHAPTAAPAAAK